MDRIALLIVVLIPAGGLEAKARPRPASGPGVRVDIETDEKGVVLVKKVPHGTSWRSERVCNAPCGKRVDPRGTFYLGGARWRSSEYFTLEGRGPHVVVTANMSRRSLRTAGVLSLATGGLFAAVGSLVVVIGTTDRTEERAPGVAITGGIGLGLGVAAVVTGIVLLAVTGKPTPRLRRAGDPLLSWRF